MIQLTEVVPTRHSTKTRQRIKKIVDKLMTKEGEIKYENESHFVRCAVQRLLKSDEVELVLQTRQRLKSRGPVTSEIAHSTGRSMRGDTNARYKKASFLS